MQTSSISSAHIENKISRTSATILTYFLLSFGPLLHQSTHTRTPRRKKKPTVKSSNVDSLNGQSPYISRHIINIINTAGDLILLNEAGKKVSDPTDGRVQLFINQFFFKKYYYDSICNTAGLKIWLYLTINRFLLLPTKSVDKLNSI